MPLFEAQAFSNLRICLCFLQFYLENLADGETKLHGQLISEKVLLNNMDVFSIAERKFRFELEGIQAKLAIMVSTIKYYTVKLQRCMIVVLYIIIYYPLLYHEATRSHIMVVIRDKFIPC